jgi:hypothetical protein
MMTPPRQPHLCLTGLALLLCLAPSLAQALTADQVIALKKAGVSDETIQMMLRQEEAAQTRGGDLLERREIKDSQGNTVVVYTQSDHPPPSAQTRAAKARQGLADAPEHVVDQRSTVSP